MRPRLSPVVFSTLLILPAVQAQTSWKTPITADWTLAGNWNNGVPTTTGENAFIANGGTAVLGSGSTGVGLAYVGGGFDGATGNLLIDGGSLTGDLGLIGTGVGSVGLARVSGGSWAMSDRLVVGLNGTGTLNLSGGSVTAGLVLVGEAASGNGTIVLSGLAGNRGVLETNQVRKVAGGNSFIFDGGVLRATRTGGYFIDTAVEIRSGGAFIDSNGHEIIAASGMTGPGGLTKLGAGTLLLIAPSSFTGGTTISGGVLQVRDPLSLGSSGTITFDGGALGFDRNALSSVDSYAARFSVAPGQAYKIDSGGLNVTLSTPLTTPGSTFAHSGNGSLTLTADNSFVSLSTNGPGVLALTGVNTIGDSIVLNSGTLVLANANAIGATGTIRFQGGLLGFTAATAGAAESFFPRFGTAPGENRYAFDTGGQTVTFGTALPAGGSLYKNGAGTLALGADNSFPLGTTVARGVLVLGSGNALGTTGPISLTGGTLAFTAASAATAAMLPSRVVASSQVSLDTAGQDVTFSAPFANPGIGGLKKLGEGTLALSGANTFSDLEVSGGTLRVGAGAGLNLSYFYLWVGRNGTKGALEIFDGAAVGGSDRLYIGRMISNAAPSDGLVTVKGMGSTLSSDSVWVGYSSAFEKNRDLGKGALVVSGGGAVNTTSLSVGYNVVFNAAQGGDYRLTVDGIGSEVNVTSATEVGRGFNGAISITGGGAFSSGSMVIGNYPNGATGVATVDVSGAGSVLSIQDDLTVGQNLAGSAAVALNVGSGGSVTVGNGLWLTTPTSGSGGSVALNIGAYDLSGTGGTVTAAAVNFGKGAGGLNFNQTDTVTFSSPIATPSNGGPGTVNQRGTGVTILTGANTYTGTTNVTDGTLRANNAAGSATGASSVLVRGAGTLEGTGSISGPVTIQGGGKLQGTLGVSGAVTVLDGGTLQGAPNVTGPVTIQDGGLLAGTPSLGATTVAGGGAVSPGGSAAGTLTAASLTLSAGTTLSFDLGAASDRIDIAGAFTLDGVLDLTPGAGFGNGTYRLMNYGGTLTDNGLGLGLAPAGYSYQVSAGAGAVNLLVSYNGLAFWKGGDGVWNPADLKWTDFDGTTSAVWSAGNTAVFRGAPASIAVSGTQSIAGLQFSAGTVLSGGALAIGGTGAAMRVDDGISARVESQISGAGGLVKSGGGVLALTGPNTFTGPVAIDSGTLEVANDGALGAASNALSFFDGALHTTATFATARPVGISASAAFDVDDGTTLTLDGVVSGPGSFVKKGAGTVVFGAAPDYRGGTIVNAGVFDATGHDLVTQFVGGAGGELRLGQLTLTGQAAASFAGNITATGGLVKTGAGEQTLTGTNAFGGVTVGGGVLRAGSAGALPSGIAYAVNGGTLDLDGYDLGVTSLSGGGSAAAIDLGTATLTVDQAANTAFAGAFRGSGNPLASAGSLVKSGAGALELSGQSHLAGSTRVIGGQLTVAAGASLRNGSYGVIDQGASALVEGTWTTDDSLNVGAMGSASLTIRNGGKVETHVDGILGGSFSNGTARVTGAGSSWSIGGALLIGGGNNGANGALEIRDGGRVDAPTVLMASAPFSRGALTISGGGTLTAGSIAKDTPAGPPVTATLTLDNGILKATGDNGDFLRGFAEGDVVVGAGGASFDTEFAAPDESGTPVPTGANVTVNAVLTGTGSLHKTGLGALTLGSANTYTGSTLVEEGTLLVNGRVAGDAAVSLGAVLGGGGTIAGNAAVAGTLAPGAPLEVGLLSFDGGLTLQSGSTVQIDLAGLSSFDRLDVHGALIYGGALNLVLSDGYALQVGDTFPILQGFSGHSGTFAGIGFSDPGVQGSFDYATGTLSVVSVPEPSTWALITASFLSFLVAWARRTRARRIGKLPRKASQGSRETDGDRADRELVGSTC